MKGETRLKSQRILWLSMVIGLGAILTACGAAAANTPAAKVVPAQPTGSAALATLPPAQPTSTAAPTEAAATPASSSAELPSCKSPVTLTPAQTEGPYYTPNSPERSSLIESGMSGTRLTVTGYVLTPDCRPIAKAWLDFWQADDHGAYDNAGYRLRGHLFTDEQGRYQLETILPGEYPGRTQHIHVKVRAANGSILTTQIYFPGEPGNDRDPIFNPALLANVQDTAAGKIATINFVVNSP